MSSEQRIEKQDTAAFFTGSALLSGSLAPSHIFMSPTFFSPLSFSPSLSLCLLSLSVCLSFALSSCRVHTVQCVLFLNEAFFSCSQPVSFTEARPQLADCGCVVAVLVHREKAWSWHLKEREKEMRKKNIQLHSRGYYCFTCALAP